MTAPPSWPSGDPEATADRPTPVGPGEHAAFRNLLGVAPSVTSGAFTSAGPVGAPGLRINPATTSQHFTIGPVSLVVQPTTGTPEQYAETARKRMRRRRRGYSFGPVYPAEVAGYPGVARVITTRKRRRLPASPPMTQMYAIVGPYGLIVTSPQDRPVPAIGPVGLFPAAPPVISPIVRLPGTDPRSVEEKLTISQGSMKLTGIVSAGQVTSSTDEFAMGVLARLQSQIADLAVDQWQPDAFLGGHACVRDTFLRGGVGGTSVRSEFWWAGVVGGRGVQVLVSGTKSIIDLREALPLRDVVVLLPPD
jgi:hypothetical protein